MSRGATNGHLSLLQQPTLHVVHLPSGDIWTTKNRDIEKSRFFSGLELVATKFSLLQTECVDKIFVAAATCFLCGAPRYVFREVWSGELTVPKASI